MKVLQVLKYTPKHNIHNYSSFDYSPSGHRDCRRAESIVSVL